MRSNLLHRRILHLTSALLLGCLALPEIAYSNDMLAAQPVHKRHVLIIYSWHDQLPWQAGVKAGIAEQQEKLPPAARAEIYEERVDSVRIANTDDTDLANYLHKKYAQIDLDAVIAESRSATDLLIKHPQLFKQAKRYAVNVTEPGNLPPGQTFAIKDDPRRALQTILQVMPDREKILVVLDNDAKFSGRTREELQDIAAALSPKVSVEFMQNFSFDELYARAGAMPPRSALLYFPVFQDRLGNKQIPRDVASKLCQVSSAPVFAHHDRFLGTGIVGGYMISAPRVGTLISLIAQGLTLPKNSAEIDAIIKEYQFDDRQLQRWGIADSRLPGPHTIINRLPTLWQTYPLQISAAIALISLQALLIVLLLRSSRQRSKALDELAAERSKLEQRVLERTHALSESEALLRATNDVSPLAIYRSSGAERRADYINKTFTKLFGYTIEQVPSAAEWWPLAYPDANYRKQIAAEWQRRINAAMEQQAPIEPMETIVTCRDGTLKHIQWHVFSSGDQHWSWGLDISERKRAERALNGFFEQPLNLHLLARTDGVILRTNANWFSVLGYTAAELNGKRFLDLVHPDDLDATLLEVAKLAQGQTTFYFENRYRHSNGSYRLLAWSATASVEDQLLYAVANDITERKQKEAEAAALREQLAQASKMESIGHLTAGIAHDFNNILGAIMGYTELTQQMLAAGKADVVGRYLTEIYKSGTRAKELIRQMLTFSRLSPEGKSESQPALSLAASIEEIISLLRPSIPSKIELDVQLDQSGLAAGIKPVHLHQILLNLIVNARDAIGEYGSIRIALAPHYIAQGTCSSCSMPIAGHHYARISVTDNGSGISEPTLKKIFDPFFTTKGVGQGTGMGLSVVHGLVHAQGGHIQVESNPASGTTFHILLPVASMATDTPALHAAQPATDIKGIRIMVVDDEPALSNMLRDYLSACGARVSEFNDPLRALDAFSRHAQDIDLVITDETMPGMSGMLLAKKMLQLKPGIPVILCTGYSDHATPESAAQSGIAGFFYKPVDMQEMMQKIMALWQNRAK